MPKPIRNQQGDPPTISDYMRVLESLIGEDITAKTMIMPGRRDPDTGELKGVAWHDPNQRKNSVPFLGVSFQHPDDVEEYGHGYDILLSPQAATNPLVRLEEAAHSVQGRKGYISPEDVLLAQLSNQLIRQGNRYRRLSNKEIEDRKERRQSQKYRRKNTRFLKDYVGSQSDFGLFELEAKAAALKSALLAEGIVGENVTKEDIPAVRQYVMDAHGKPSALSLLLDAAETEKGMEKVVEYLNMF